LALVSCAKSMTRSSGSASQLWPSLMRRYICALESLSTWNYNCQLLSSCGVALPPYVRTHMSSSQPYFIRSSSENVSCILVPSVLTATRLAFKLVLAHVYESGGIYDRRSKVVHHFGAVVQMRSLMRRFAQLGVCGRKKKRVCTSAVTEGGASFWG
jgi:hypothetical protein